MPDFPLFCIKCGNKLEEPGGLLFSPPRGISTCDKHHLCKKCYGLVCQFILGDLY